MTKIENPPTKVIQPSLDQRIVDKIGRIPYSLLFAVGVAIAVELIVLLKHYIFLNADFFTILDHVNRFAFDNFRPVCFFGTIGGLSVGLFTCLATMRIQNKLLRGVLGLVIGLFARYIAEIFARTYTEGTLTHGLDYARFFMDTLIPSGMIEGFIVALLPLSKKRF